MLTRRGFGRLCGLASLDTVRAGAMQNLSAVGASDRCSVMLWALAGVAKPFSERLALAANAGFRCVELVGEFRDWSETEWVEVLGRMRALGLSVDAIAPLKLGFADPAGGAAMLAELRSVLPAMRRLGSPQIILVSGPRASASAAGGTAAAGASSTELGQYATAVETLRQVAAMLEREGMVAVIEPIDRIENPPVYLDSVTEAFALTRAVGSPHVKVLYDFFHEQRTKGNLIEKLEGGIAEVGLVHVADVPGRHQPGTGEIDYANVYRALCRLGYKGRVAMEFYPQGEAAAVLRQARLEAEHLLGVWPLPAFTSRGRSAGVR